jgi:excinuclease UvrABC ATPase subunit
MQRGNAVTSKAFPLMPRQFFDQMEKPNVDFIQGLSPPIAIEHN